MKKYLRFEIKQNLHNPGRVYVRKADSKDLCGSFRLDTPDDFDNWDSLNGDEKVELNFFIKNIKAINSHLLINHSESLSDIRLRLPDSLVKGLYDISRLCEKNGTNFNIFDSIITSIVQNIKVSTNELCEPDKQEAQRIIERLNLTGINKQDHKDQIRVVFSELQKVLDFSQKLYLKSDILFEKNKRYSNRAIQGMALGETVPSKWLVSCAIDILLDESPSVIQTILTPDDFFMLYIRPMSKSKISSNNLSKNISKIENVEYERTI